MSLHSGTVELVELPERPDVGGCERRVRDAFRVSRFEFDLESNIGDDVDVPRKEVHL